MAGPLLRPRNGGVPVPVPVVLQIRPPPERDKVVRSYYRCTNKTFYGCDAKKQVQRTDDDPRTYEITYCGHHTCHTTGPLPVAANPIGAAEQERLEPLPVGGFAGAGPLFPAREAPVKTMEQQLLEYADAIFNSGSSSSNSIDSFFSPKGER
ncbi:hypothetical protein EJ110_NYTH47907 [Nymphaea thermarum]|nr:hypothetical protein EJ110_NYTH47907 [Nymphaea thermarum]